ncbi:hypothetical protein Tco_0057976 [Tanacetum coccineum]
MQMLYRFVNNFHVDYAELLWEGFHYSLKNPTRMIPYPRFIKLIMSHYMTTFPEISRRARDRYHNLADDVMIKSIFNSRKSKDVVGMKIPDWMITDEMKLMKNYQLYAEVFGVDVPKTQSQLIESTQRTHRTTSSPRTPNHKIAEGESSALRKSTIIRLLIQDTIQVSQNLEKVKEHLMAEEIEKLVEGSENVEENVEVASSPLRNDDYQTDLGTRTREFRSEITLQVNDAITNHIPSQVDSSVRSYMLGHDDLPIWLALKYKFERLHMAATTCIPSAVRPRDQDDPHDDAHPEGENSAKRQKTSEHGTFVFGESLSDQDYEKKSGPSTSGNQEQSDDFDFWTNSYVIDDDVLPNEKVSQELMDEISQTVDEAKLRKVVDEMLRQKFILPDDDIEERTSRWVNKCVKKFNPYAWYNVEHWKNPHAKIFYIKKQQEPGKPKEEIYSNSKIVQIIKTYWELGHEHKFITEIVTRKANGSIVSISEPDYMNLNKNDIEDMYLLIINHKVNLTAPTITFPGIEKYEMFSIVTDPIYGIIYKNSKKEKRVMRHQEIHMFCDATLSLGRVKKQQRCEVWLCNFQS